MTSRLRALFLLVAILWQSIGALGDFSIQQRAAEFAQLTVHVQEADYYHHADHTLHMDVDESSMQHVHADVGSGGVALLAATWPNPLDLSTLRFPDSPASLWLSPTLEGPLRPPRHIA